MKKLLAIFTAVMLVSCTTNHDEVVVSTPNKNSFISQQDRAKQVVMEFLNKIDPPTRGSVRTINRIETITYEELFGPVTRSDSTLSIRLNPQRNENSIALMLTIFDDNSGYAVLQPLFDEDDYFVGDWEDDNGEEGSTSPETPIKLLAVINSGTLSSNDIITYTNNTTAPDDYLSPTELYDEENDDFVIGNSDPNTFVASLISSYLYNKTENDNNNNDYTEVDNIATEKVGPLLKTKWWQELPFNYYIHTYNEQGDKRPVGCVTVATAQMLTYFKDKQFGAFFEVSSASTT